MLLNFLLIFYNFLLLFLFFSTASGAEFFDTGRGNRGLKCDGFIYKKHYETATSLYWTCTLSNKLKCRVRAITDLESPSEVRFNGKMHNHTEDDYLKGYKTAHVIHSSSMSFKSEVEFDMQDN